MQNNLLVFDDFLPDPWAVREEVLKLPFYDIRLHGGINKRIHPRSSDEHKERLEEVLNRRLEQNYTLFRLSYAGEFSSEVVHQDSDIADLVCVTYLSRPEDCRGGTALWKNKATGRIAQPTHFDIRRCGKSPKREFGILEGDCQGDISAWERVETSEMKFNRMVAFPAACFHSRWPLEGWGTKPEDGRFIWVTFAKCLG